MNFSNKTFLPTVNHKKRNWFVIDCKEQKLGRLTTIVVGLLKGKAKPSYHPAIDEGDYIILKNADSIILHEKSKHFLVYNPGRPGSSLKIKSVSDCLPQLTIERALKGMLSKTETKRLMRRVNIYNGNEHPHTAQNPIELSLSNYYSDFELQIEKSQY